MRIKKPMFSETLKHTKQELLKHSNVYNPYILLEHKAFLVVMLQTKKVFPRLAASSLQDN